MYPSQQNSFAPSRAPLHHIQHTPVPPPPLHIPYPAPYSGGQPMANSNIHPMAANGTRPMEANNMSPLPSGNGVPPSPSQASSAEDLSNYELPDLPTMSRIWGKYGYALKIVQQPQRARMCGFGDKDRRPITPPLIAQLLIVDPTTTDEYDYEKTMHWSKLVVSVNLWEMHGRGDLSLLKHDQSGASISTTTLASYPPVTQPQTGRQQPVFPYDITNHPAYTREHIPLPPSQPSSVQSSPYERNLSYSSGSQPSYNGHYQNGYNNGFQQQNVSPEAAPSPPTPILSRPSQDMGSPGPNKVEPSRNLIGSCHSSLQRLEGIDGKIGLFFIFQDMSVRTEGWFRLKCQLFALGKLGLDGEEEIVDEIGEGLFLEAPCLASTFSKPFKVFSAKKFPGVVETTPWSEKFANQGIKIPIRKSEAKGKGKKRTRGDDSDEENDDEDD